MWTFFLFLLCWNGGSSCACQWRAGCLKSHGGPVPIAVWRDERPCSPVAWSTAFPVNNRGYHSLAIGEAWDDKKHNNIYIYIYYRFVEQRIFSYQQKRSNKTVDKDIHEGLAESALLYMKVCFSCWPFHGGKLSMKSTLEGWTLWLSRLPLSHANKNTLC